MPDRLVALVRFARALRDEGLAVGTDRIVAFCEAAALLDPAEVYWAGRATLTSSRDDVVVYERVFRFFFGGEERRLGPAAAPARCIAAGGVAPVDVRGAPGDAESAAGLASRVEVLRRKSFARCTPEELAEVRSLLARVEFSLPVRRSRRRAPARSGALDLRRTLRRSVATGGDAPERAWTRRRERRRRLVLLLDVSGSMAPYSRALLVFAHAALRADRHAEVFCFGTRLTRVTRPLAVADPDDALRRAAAEVADWDGGTRIGDSLKAFLDGFGRGPARGAIVVVCSDGLDVGDPALLGEQMERLALLAYRVVWLNPLKEDPRYEPLARGMQAALPHVDHFGDCHDLASLEALAHADLRTRGGGRRAPPRRYERAVARE